MKYAQIIENVVVNVIVWNGETELGLEGELVQVADEIIGVGFTYDGTTFTAPPVAVEEELPT